MSTVVSFGRGIFDDGPAAPDKSELATFVSRVFRNCEAGEGAVGLRAFRNGGGECVWTEWPIFGEGLVDRALEGAAVAARRGLGDAGANFCPPVCLFVSGTGAKLTATQDDVVAGPVIAVEIDHNPSTSLAKLVSVLGEATVVVASGGRTAGEDRLHAYWRLKRPARTKSDRAMLKTVRRYACALVGEDKSGVPLNHPMRWPGALHTKGAEARLCRIVGGDAAREVDLVDAGRQVMDACAQAGVKVDGRVTERSGPRQGFKTKTPMERVELFECAALIENEDLPWDEWNRIAMAFWDASHGGDDGLEAFIEWSTKSAKFGEDHCESRWSHYFLSPPGDLSAGTLIYQAQQADPSYRRPHFVIAKWFEPLRGTVDLMTEFQVARAFVELNGHRLRYAEDTDTWFAWEGEVWQRVARSVVSHRAARLIEELARDLAIEAVQAKRKRASPDEIRKSSEKATFVRNVLLLARDYPNIAIRSEHLDRDAWKLGTSKGAVDLRTGRLEEADPDDLITKSVVCAPGYTTECPLWLKFLDEATGKDAAMIRFLQQFAGYCLTGSTKEHALLFLFGDGGNGKSVFLNVVARILGDYSTVAPMETFISNRFEGHSTSLAMLRGARLVTASETEQGRAWNEARIKAATGGEPITARFMRQDNFTFLPEFKLVVAGNHKPVLRNVDGAARRRFNMVPFTRKPSKVDRQLEEKLMGEAPAILRWMIDGCLDWQANGLVRPASVLSETEAYFADQDVFSHWFDETVELATEDDFVAASSLFSSWSSFAKQANEEVGTARAFADRLISRGLISRRTKLARGYSGLKYREKGDG